MKPPQPPPPAWPKPGTKASPPRPPTKRVSCSPAVRKRSPELIIISLTRPFVSASAGSEPTEAGEAGQRHRPGGRFGNGWRAGCRWRSTCRIVLAKTEMCVIDIPTDRIQSMRRPRFARGGKQRPLGPLGAQPERRAERGDFFYLDSA